MAEMGTAGCEPGGDVAERPDDEMNSDVVDVILSVAGSRVSGMCERLAEYLVARTDAFSQGIIDEEVAIASVPGSAMASVLGAWRQARGLPPLPSYDRHEPELEDRHLWDEAKERCFAAWEAKRAEIAIAAASNDVARLGPLLIGHELSDAIFRSRHLPVSLARRPDSFLLPRWYQWSDLDEDLWRKPRPISVLEVAAGAGAVEATRCLLEFYGAKPSREAVKMAISSGNVEVSRMLWQRLPEAEQEFRLDFLEIAADFHQPEPLTWLFRDASPLEREVFAEFALKRHLADALLVVEGGVQIWSWRTRELAGAWAAAVGLELVPAPEGLSVDCGWWVNESGAVTTLARDEERPFRFPWESLPFVKRVTIPGGTESIAACAFWERYTEDCGVSAEDLTEVAAPPNVTQIGRWAFFYCSALREFVIPRSVKGIDAGIFDECHALARLAIPAGVTCTGGFRRKFCFGCRLGVDKPTDTCCSSLVLATVAEGAAGVGLFASSCVVTRVVISRSTGQDANMEW
jgi:hypothetical protein